MAVFGLEDVITFGKYKGCVVKNVIAKNSGYVSWAVENVEWFNLTPEAQALLSATPNIYPRRRSRYGVGGFSYDDYEDEEDDAFGLGIGDVLE
jgi:hypothetical protein